MLSLLVAGELEAHPRIPQTSEAAPTEVASVPAIDSVRETPSPPSLVAASGRSLSSWLVLAIAVTLAGATVRRSRRATVLAMVALLLVFVAESTVHSVHHFGDLRGAAQCQVLSLSQHLSADCPTPVGVPLPAGDPGLPVVTAASSPPVELAFRPDQGRAPPALHS